MSVRIDGCHSLLQSIPSPSYQGQVHDNRGDNDKHDDRGDNDNINEIEKTTSKIPEEDNC